QRSRITGRPRLTDVLRGLHARLLVSGRRGQAAADLHPDRHLHPPGGGGEDPATAAGPPVPAGAHVHGGGLLRAVPGVLLPPLLLTMTEATPAASMALERAAPLRVSVAHPLGALLALWL